MRTWILNPAAEFELAHGPSYEPPKRLIEQMQERGSAFDLLTQGEPRVFLSKLGERSFAGRVALLWCPTTRAVKQARASGFAVPESPPHAVLARVNRKTFPTEACPSLTHPERTVVTTRAALTELQSRVGGRLRVRRPFGFAGKGQRVVGEAARADDERWLTEAFGAGPVTVEPELDGAEQVSIHGVVAARELILGRACRLSTDRFGAPRGVALLSPEDAPTTELERALRERAERAAEALQGHGYFGPFGLDFLVARAQPILIDVNARFTLGFSVGLGRKREQALEQVLARVR